MSTILSWQSRLECRSKNCMDETLARHVIDLDKHKFKRKYKYNTKIFEKEKKNKEIHL